MHSRIVYELTDELKQRTLYEQILEYEFMKFTRLFLLSILVLTVAGCSWPSMFGGDDDESVQTLTEDDRRLLFEKEMAQAGAQQLPSNDQSNTLPTLPEPERLEKPKELMLVEVDGPAPSPENDPMLNDAPTAQASVQTSAQTRQLQDPQNMVSDEKLRELEYNIAALEGNVDLLRPAYQRIEALESQMVRLMQKLDMLVRAQSGYNQHYAQQPQTPSYAQRPSPVMERGQPQNTRSQPAARSGGAKIIDARLGVHRDKTRLVLDVEGDTSYRYDIDRAENLLMIELPDAQWDRRAGRSEGQFNNKLFRSYVAQPMDGGGIRMIAQLNHSASVIKAEKLAATNGKPSRIYFDLRSPAIHN